MKKILISIFTLTLLFVFTTNLDVVKASSPNLKNIESVEEEQINSSLKFNQYKIDSAMDPLQAFTTRDVFSYTLSPNASTRLAAWTYASPSGFKMANLIEIAKNFEENNPGWIVLGGVNAEGYYEGELTNAFMQEGDLIRKDVSSEVFKELIGFKENGEKVIKQVPKTSEYARLNVNGKKYDIKYINSLPQGNDVGVLTIDLKDTLNLTGYYVVEGNYSLYRRTKKLVETTLNGPNLGLFIKGKITGLTNISTISNVPDSKFYIVTKDQTLASSLTKDLEVKCQFDYLEEFEDVNTMVGYMYKLVINGQSVPLSFVDTNETGGKVVYDCAYYKSTSKQRCGIGFKDDGSIVLMTSNTQRGGPTQYEFGEMFKEFGCKEAYQFDGGGSVTFLKRNALGEIEMLNTPGDGHIRSLLSGLFIVTKDPAYEQDFINSTSSKIVLKKKTSSFTNAITDYKLTFNGKDFYPENDEIVLDGLNDNTTYNLCATYTENGVTYNVEFTAKTKEFKPNVTFTPTINGFNVSSKSTDDNFEIKEMIYNVSENIYNTSSSELVIDDLDKDREYLISYICKYQNLKTGEILTKEVKGENYSTLPFVIPSIETFEISKYSTTRVVIEYKYLDPDKVLNEAYIVFDGTKYDLEVTYGKLTIRDLNLQSGTYKLQMFLKYNDKAGKLKIVTSETKKFEIEHTHEFNEATCTTPKTCKICDLTEGDALGHDASVATCTDPSVCKRCHERLVDVLGHDFKDADYEHPKTCTRCGKTEGSPLPKEETPKKNKCKKSSLSTFIISFIPLTIVLFIRRKKH